MKFSPPHSIALTAEESELYAKIDAYSKKAHPSHEEWLPVADAMESLVTSLIEREAVPEIRVRLFTDPELAETGNKSRQQVFESNGTSSPDIFRHPHFIPYLKHFIHGPDLPKAAIDGLCRILDDDMGTSGMVLDQYRKHARLMVREYRLDKSRAATEFYRLGIEIGMDQHSAKSLRDAAKTTK